MGVHRVYIVLLVLWFAADLTVTTKNEIIIERMMCPPTKPESLFQNFTCKLRYISKNYLTFDIRWNITRPLHESWLHGTLYHKFNGITWSKFPIDLWEDMCAWMSGKRKAYLLDWTFGTVLKYSNFNHTCPFYGYYVIDIKNITKELFVVEPLLPSGKYRLDVEFTQQQSGGVPFTVFYVYFSVSDYRLVVI